MKSNKKNLKPIKRPVGRPKYLVNEASKEEVCRLVALGYSQRAVAKSLGINVNTLRERFKEELVDGKELAAIEVDRMLYAAAISGNVSAIRNLRSIMHSRVVKEETPVEDKTENEPEKKRGKKDKIQHEADNISGKYAPPSPPNRTLQ